MKTIIASICATLMLVACNGAANNEANNETNSNKNTVTETVRIPVEVIHKKNPKHFRLKVKDEHGNVHNFSKKRCSNHKHYEEGKKYIMLSHKEYHVEPTTGVKTLKSETIKHPCYVLFEKV